MMGDQSAALQLAAGLVGGSLAAASHATKSGTRVLINTRPEPFSNWTASVVEDVAVFSGIWLMLNHPWLYLVLLVVFILVLFWLLPRLWRAIRFLFQKLAAFFGGEKPEPLSPDEARVIHLPHKPDSL
jgi:TRAP-type C4-dicarboxylate transport system permease small subunit